MPCGNPYSRSRESGAWVDAGTPQKRTLTQCNGTKVVQFSSSGPGLTGTTKVTKDFVIPCFTKLSRQGRIFNNPFQTVEDTISRGVGGTRTVTRIATCTGTTEKSTEYIGMFYYNWPNGPLTEWNASVVNSNVSSAVTLAGTQAMGNVSSPAVTGLVELAELRKTLKLFHSPLASLRKFLSDIKKSKRYKNWKKSHTGSFGVYLSSEWLRYRYGILPLVSTVASLMDVVDTFDAKSPPRFTARGTQTIEEMSETSDFSGVFDTTSDHEWTKTQSVTGQVRCGVLYEHDFTLAGKLGLRFRDVPGAAWELIPYSFVVDWFVNIGDYLEAVTPKAGVRVLSTWTTTDISHHREYSGRVWVARPASGWTASGDNSYWYSRTTRTKARKPGVTIGLAMKHWEGNTHDFKHVADAVALTLQQLIK